MSKKIEKFEDFIARQKAQELAREIYNVTSLGHFAGNFGLHVSVQLRKSLI